MGLSNRTPPAEVEAAVAWLGREVRWSALSWLQGGNLNEATKERGESPSLTPRHGEEGSSRQSLVSLESSTVSGS